MGFMDKITGNVGKVRGKVTEVVDQHGDKIDQGIGKASKFVSNRTGGKYDQHIAKGSDSLRSGLDKLDNKSDDFGGVPPSPPQSATPPPPPPPRSDTPPPPPPSPAADPDQR